MVKGIKDAFAALYTLGYFNSAVNGVLYRVNDNAKLKLDVRKKLKVYPTVLVVFWCNIFFLRIFRTRSTTQRSYISFQHKELSSLL